jgi:uncharacterized membrane protein YfcA
MSVVFLVWSAWFAYSMPHTLSILKDNWPVTVTMVFGSFIAGATSEGGGAVAFPVFTKILHIAPTDAKIFSLAIQSVGMTAATLTIIVMRIEVAWRLILWTCLGGLFGIVAGSVWLAPVLQPALLKMLFTSMIASFALPLAVISRQDRQYNVRMPVFGWREKGIMLLTGAVGGTMTALVGNGIGTICFSVMVLLFGLTEKVSTPTAVVLMAVNALIGFILHLTVWGGFTEQVKHYWLAAVPVVVVGAPFGAYCCTKLNNKTIAVILIFLILVEFVSSLCLIPLTKPIAGISLAVFIVFLLLYYQMSRSMLYRSLKEKN